jgi:hypothetical protein
MNQAVAKRRRAAITAETHVVRLAAARRALREATSLPEISDLADQAEVVRVAARACGLSVEGVNDWTRFKIDAQCEGATKIEELRAAGLLATATTGRPQKASPGGRLILADLIGTRAWQRASEWAKQRALSIAEKNEIWQKANLAQRLISEKEVTKLGAAKSTKARRDESRGAAPLADGMELRIGDCRTVLADLSENSVPLILTDPPYGDEAEPLYHWLADFAARVLIPGGSLVCYTGQSRLDRDMAILSSKLRYWWLLIMQHDQSQRFPGKFVIANFKPVVWYVKDYRRGRSLLPDILKSPARDKELHNWSQGDGGVSPIIEHLTDPSELIVDPFAGTANWGRRAAAMGRRWLGADVVEGGAETVQAAE